MTDTVNPMPNDDGRVENEETSVTSVPTEAAAQGGADAVPETHHADDAEPGVTKDDERGIL